MIDISERFKHLKMIDLTHPLSSKIPSWNGSVAFELYNEDQIQMLTSGGTHIDAPVSFFDTGMGIDQIPLDQLFGPACLIDVSRKAGPDYQISPDDIEEYETVHGQIHEGDLIVGFTGWSRHWTNPQAYRNIDEKGHTHFPTFSFSSIELLLKRKIRGVAIDTLALESLNSSFPCHKLLLGAGKYIIENIANASQLPARGAYILALPIKIEKGQEAPARVIGLI